MRTTSIRLDDDLFDQIELLARVEARSVSDLVRQAVELFLQTQMQDEVVVDRVTAAAQDWAERAVRTARSLAGHQRLSNALGDSTAQRTNDVANGRSTASAGGQ